MCTISNELVLCALSNEFWGTKWDTALPLTEEIWYLCYDINIKTLRNLHLVMLNKMAPFPDKSFLKFFCFFPCKCISKKGGLFYIQGLDFFNAQTVTSTTAGGAEAANWSLLFGFYFRDAERWQAQSKQSGTKGRIKKKMRKSFDANFKETVMLRSCSQAETHYVTQRKSKKTAYNRRELKKKRTHNKKTW